MSFGEFEVAGEVLTDDVKLDIDLGAYIDELEVCILVGVGDDTNRHVARVTFDVRFAHGEAHAIDGDGSFVYAEVPSLDHLRCGVIGKAEVPTAVCLAALDACGFLIHVPLYDVTVQRLIECHRALQVDEVTYTEGVEVSKTKCLLHGGNGVGVFIRRYHRQTYAVMRYRLIDAHRVTIRVAQREVLIRLLLVDANDLSHFFYYSREHLLIDDLQFDDLFLEVLTDDRESGEREVLTHQDSKIDTQQHSADGHHQPHVVDIIQLEGVINNQQVDGEGRVA